MALFVNTNVSALNGQRNLQNVTDRMNGSFEKLSSGSRINSAKDDAAGLQISDRLTTQIIGLQQGTRNANDGISIAQIAEGALGEITTNIQRMRQLVVQGGNRTLSSDDRNALSQEFEKLLSVNNDISDRTAFGTMKILNEDSNEAGFQIQSGAQSGEQDTVTTGNSKLTALFGEVADDATQQGNMMSDMTVGNLDEYGTLGQMVAAYMIATGTSVVSDANEALYGDPAGESVTVAEFGTKSARNVHEVQVSALVTILQSDGQRLSDGNGNAVASDLGAALANVMTVTAANSSTGFSDASVNVLNAFMTDTLMDLMSNLVTEVDSQRAKLGAEQNGLASTIRSNTTSVVNVSDSRSRIQDTDFAAETAELTRNQIIQQAATSILSQANQLPQAALSLLG